MKIVAQEDLRSFLFINWLTFWLNRWILIVRQTNNFAIDEPLTIIARLGVSFSLHTIRLQQYRVNSQLTIDDLIPVTRQICHNICRLKVMTIEFRTDDLFDNDILEKFTEIQKKNCLLALIHVSRLMLKCGLANDFNYVRVIFPC